MADYDSSDYSSSTNNATNPTYDPSTDTMKDPGSTDYGADFWKWLQGTTGGTSSSSILDSITKLLSGTSSFGPAGQFLAAAGIGKLLSNITGGSGQTGPAGYKGGIPEYTATRTQTPMAQQRPTTTGADGKVIPYRPGQGGITYFAPMQYTPTGRDLAAPTATAPAPAQAGATDTSAGIGGNPQLPLDPQAKQMIDSVKSLADNPAFYARGGSMADQGIAMLAGGRYLRGPGDGVSDSIPARFERSGQPARLADGEFVIDARTVSELGNGSSEAGARKLYAMMDRVHKARKTAKRGKPSGADKFLPK